jgi:hypothetical protein
VQLHGTLHAARRSAVVIVGACGGTIGALREAMRVSRWIGGAVVVAMLVLVPDVASAQAPGQVVAQPAPPAPAVKQRKNPNLALALSLAPWLTGIAMAGNGNPTAELIAFGFEFVGPSLGHIYVGRIWTTGLALRLGGLAVTAFGVGLFVTNRAPCTAEWCFFPSAANTTGSIGLGLAFAGATTILVGAIHDIWTARRDARDYNRAHGVDATVAPVTIRAASSTAPGLALVGRF